MDGQEFRKVYGIMYHRRLIMYQTRIKNVNQLYHIGFGLYLHHVSSCVRAVFVSYIVLGQNCICIIYRLGLGLYLYHISYFHFQIKCFERENMTFPFSQCFYGNDYLLQNNNLVVFRKLLFYYRWTKISIKKRPFVNFILFIFIIYHTYYLFIP